MPFSIDPLKFVGQLIAQHKLNEWAKLLFSLGFSYALAFNFTAGAALSGGMPAWKALGAGMVAGASAMLFLFARSPLTKGLLISAPRELVLEAETREELVTIKK